MNILFAFLSDLSVYTATSKQTVKPIATRIITFFLLLIPSEEAEPYFHDLTSLGSILAAVSSGARAPFPNSGL